MSIILLLYIMYVDIAVDRLHAFKCFKVIKIKFAGLCVLYQTQETVKVCVYPKAPTLSLQPVNGFGYSIR